MKNDEHQKDCLMFPSYPQLAAASKRAMFHCQVIKVKRGHGSLFALMAKLQENLSAEPCLAQCPTQHASAAAMAVIPG